MNRADACAGLTVREHFAAMAMQALLAKGDAGHDVWTYRRAWQAADFLLQTSGDPYLVYSIMQTLIDVAAYQDRLPPELAKEIQRLIKLRDDLAKVTI